MRLYFLLALLLLIFTGGSNDFVRADQSIKEATRHGVRTPSQVTEGTQRSASVAEDETTTINEERGFFRSKSLKPLIDEAIATKAFAVMSKDPLVMKTMQENPAAKEKLMSFAKSVSQKNYKNSEDLAAIRAEIKALTDSPDVANVIKAIMDNPKMAAQVRYAAGKALLRVFGTYAVKWIVVIATIVVVVLAIFSLAS